MKKWDLPLWVMNLIFQTWAHIKKDLLIYETPLVKIKDKAERVYGYQNEELNQSAFLNVNSTLSCILKSTHHLNFDFR